jgi:hypothetical protein
MVDILDMIGLGMIIMLIILLIINNSDDIFKNFR